MATDPVKALEQIAAGIESKVKAAVWNSVTAIRDRLKGDLLAGGALQKRTRGLPVVRVKPEAQGNLIVGGVRSPVPWAPVHFGPRGRATTISGKGMLALPTDFVKTFRGTAVGPRRYGSGKVILHGIIFGQAGWHGSAGLRSHRAGGERFRRTDLVPLFILKGSVVVKARIDPQQDLIEWVKPKFMEEIRKILAEK